MPPRESNRSSRRRLAAVREDVDYGRALDSARREMYAAQDAVKALKAAGKPFRQEAAVSRAARARYLALTGGVDSRTIEVSMGASSGKVKPLD